MVIHGPPDEIIQQSIDSIEIEPELLTLQRIEETISSTKQLRQSAISKLQNRINNLQSQLDSINNEITLLNKVSDYNYETLSKIGDDPISQNEDESIFKVLKRKNIELDSIKVSLAKNLNDLESSVNSLNLNKDNLVNQSEELKTELDNVINSNVTLDTQDSNILKINLYKNIGVKIETFDEISTSSSTDRIIIYNRETDVSSILKVDDKYSDFFITNYIWDRLDDKAL